MDSGGTRTKVAIASGKGGTGKTLLATNLAAVTDDAVLVDLDVEEPNCYLFHKGEGDTTEEAFRPVPSVDNVKCTLCGKCGEVCEFHAIVVLPKEVMIFEELCHACGACSLFCPEDAISEKNHLIGDIVSTSGDAFDLLYGRLRVGEAMPTHLIRQVRKRIPEGRQIVLDCPPGTSCAPVESIRGADLCILVTEPTPFGFHDLKLALGVTEKLKVRTEVFINKHGLPGPDIEAFCNDSGIRVIGRLPLDRGIAERYSRGELLTGVTDHRRVFESLRDRIKEILAT